MDIVTKMKKQHSEIENLLQEINNYTNDKNWNPEKIFQLITIFKTILLEHLKLEDEEFYPALFKKLEKTEKLQKEKIEVEEFMKKIDNLVEKVLNFFEKYSSIEKIQSTTKEEFISDFIKIQTKLEIRMNVEELSIYLKWEVLKDI